MAARRTRLARQLLLAGFVALTVGCTSTAEAGDTSETSPSEQAETANVGAAEPVTQPNILLLIADDYGVESSGCYRELDGTADLAPTPRIQELCESGMVYDSAWSSPICSPTRSGMLTGRHGFRTGIGEQASRDNLIEIGPDEATLPRVLDQANSGYRHASFGKWHLGGDADNPNTMGWSHFSGLLIGGLQDYSSWTKTVDGQGVDVDRYATTEIVDDTLDWIGEPGDQPWLAWVAFNAPHTPFHLPPAELHSADMSGTAADIEENPGLYYNAAVEAMDTEIGRLLDGLTPDVLANTVVVFVGDNGTPSQVSSFPRGQAKGGLYEGGLHVPFVISGPGVAAGRNDTPVGTVDLFATALELAEVDLSVQLADVAVDSVSLVPTLNGDTDQGRSVMSEIFGSETRENRQGKAIRDDRYKVIEFSDGRVEFFDLQADPRGEVPTDAGALDDAQAEALDRLLATLRSWTADPDGPRPVDA